MKTLTEFSGTLIRMAAKAVAEVRKSLPKEAFALRVPTPAPQETPTARPHDSANEAAPEGGLDSATEHGSNFAKGKGCSNCSGTGYRGRFSIFEIFVIDDEARKLIYEKVPSSVLRTRAREMGMRTLREDGIRKAQAGLTTCDEVIRSTVGDVE